MIPCWESLEDDLNLQLLPDFEQNARERGIECEFDTSEVRALQENQGEREKRAIEAFARGVTTLNEARAQFGYDPDPAGDYYLLPNNARPVLASVAMARASQELTDPLASPPDTGNQPGEEEQKRLLPPSFFFKSIEWQGLTLRREPTALEARVIKQIDEAQRSGQMSLQAQLLALRRQFIEDLVAELESLDPSDYHQATAKPTEAQRSAIATLLVALFLRGAQLILQELRNQGATVTGEITKPDAGEMTAIASAIVSRVANDVQARGTAAALSAYVLNQPIIDTVLTTFEDGSTGYVARAAGEASNWAIAAGRDAEIRARAEAVDFLVYSAVLDANTCTPCGEADGMTGDLDSIPSVPNPDCEGGAQCRCVHIPVVGNLEPLPEEQSAEF